jgi:hypothetical protein
VIKSNAWKMSGNVSRSEGLHGQPAAQTTPRSAEESAALHAVYQLLCQIAVRSHSPEPNPDETTEEDEDAASATGY